MIVSAAKWYTVAHIFRNVVIWGMLLLYAKFLPPEKYGMLVILNIVYGIVLLLKDFGLGAALIKSEEDCDSFYSSLYWLNLIFSFICFTSLYAIIAVISDSNFEFNNNSLLDAVQVLSVCFLILGVSGLKISSFEKEYKFKLTATIELISLAFGTFVGILSLVLECQIWAYVMQVIAQSISLMLLLFFVSKRHVLMHFSWREIKEARYFGGNVMGFSIFNYVMKNLDSIIIGSFLGEAALGLYSLAFRFVIYPIQTVSVIAQRVLFPIFSRITDKAEFNRQYTSLAVFLVVFLFPIYVIVYFSAPILIFELFGNDWGASIQLLNILIPAALMQVFVAPVGIIYQAKGRADLLFKWGVFSSTFMLGVIVISVKWGIEGVANGLLLGTAILFIPALKIPFSLMNYSLGELFISVRKTLSIVVFSFLMTLFFKEVFAFDYMLFSTVILSTFFLLLYTSLMWVVEKNTVNKILEAIGCDRQRAP